MRGPKMGLLSFDRDDFWIVRASLARSLILEQLRNQKKREGTNKLQEHQKFFKPISNITINLVQNELSILQQFFGNSHTQMKHIRSNHRYWKNARMQTKTGNTIIISPAHSWSYFKAFLSSTLPSLSVLASTIPLYILFALL